MILAKISLVLFGACALLGAGTVRAEDTARWVPYRPTPVTLTGTITKAVYGDEQPAGYQGTFATILRLDQPISLHGLPGDLSNEEAVHVTEVQLWYAETKYPFLKGKVARGSHFSVTGTLRHQIRTVELRTITMDLTDLQPVAGHGGKSKGHRTPRGS